MTDETLSAQEKSKTVSSKNDKNLTPLMKQYEQLKAAHSNEILLLRLGDFYEMFNEDAKCAAPVLEVALTQRQGVPMCGIPHHAADRYILKLLKKGFRVSIAEQTEDPETAKGLVSREVVRTISAGTIIEDHLLKEKTNNFLAAVVFENQKSFQTKRKENEWRVSLAALDVSTGQFYVTEFESAADFTDLKNELARMSPAEVLILEDSPDLRRIFNEASAQRISKTDLEKIDPETFPILKTIGPKENFLSLQAGKMICVYIQKMNPAFLHNIQPPKFYSHSDSMILDRETIENLEILKNSSDGSTHKTLLEFLDRTCTSMGGRLLRQWLIHPLINIQKIGERIESVEFFIQESSKRKIGREILKGISDLERMIVRVSSGHANPRDLIGIKISLSKSNEIKKVLTDQISAATDPFSSVFPDQIKNLISQFENCDDLISTLQNTLSDEPPVHLENGGIIRSGYDPYLDEKRKAADEGKKWLQDLELREKERTGISTLKIGYTSVFGYYIEVTKSHLSKVPPSWHRKQTLINVERFVNEELKELESKILGAEEQCLRMERAIFQKVVEFTKTQSEKIRQTAELIAQLDCLMSLSEVAEIKALVKPVIDESDEIKIVDGWHPSVKESLPSGAFVPNDSFLNGTSQHTIILTGPNMSGKSTYLRQTALIVLMAQVGSFLPAKEAKIGAVDRIFTRIGSGDRLAQGESTFMVEMQETARIMRYSTSKSLIILDEVGRGTSTYDGISIAWAVVEHLSKNIKPKVLFATHYFELTQLAHEFVGVKNYNVQAKEWQDSVIFLHKIVPGPADKSYGIHVAQLAGLPPEVIQRAKKILRKLEQKHQSLLQLNKASKELFLFPNDYD